MDFIKKTVASHIDAAPKYSGWILLLFASVFVYWPGLAGPFLFDDFGTIADLGDHGGVKDWITFKAYVFGGFTGPTGRPLSLLTFLVDGNDWPTDAWPFKRTNLVIHIINGGLLGLITVRILRLVDIEKNRSQWLGLLCAACWLLHPFLVSTTLYAVQRMAQLSTMFVFLGMAFYLRGRSFLPNRPVKAYLTMTLALGFCTFLAMISKENGILLPTLVLVMEFTIFASQEKRLPALNRNWSALFLVAPSVIIVAYLAYQLAHLKFFEVNLPRDFSIFERLLTQSRILLDYLRHWFIPEIYTSGVFQDHFIKSTGFLSPVSTAISAVFHVLLIALGIVQRRKWPLFAFAVLFFYAGHVLESTVLNLELYFEHRNYLPAAFLFLPVIALLRDKVKLPIFTAIVLSMLLVLGGFTRHTSTVWQSYPGIVEASAKKAPTSARAQQQYSLMLFNSQKYDEAIRVTDAAIERIPGNAQLYLSRSLMLCKLNQLSIADFEKMTRVVMPTAYDMRALDIYTGFVASVTGGNCPSIPLDKLRGFFSGMLRLPINADPNLPMFSQIKYFIGLVDVYLREPERAQRNFQESLQSRPGAGHAMQMAALLASNEYYGEALQLSDLALADLDSADNELIASGQISRLDVEEFREKLLAEIKLLSEKDASDSNVAE